MPWFSFPAPRWTQEKANDNLPFSYQSCFPTALALKANMSSPTQSGTTLGGAGTIDGAATNNACGTLSPGASIGTLTLNGDLIVAAGSTNTFEVDGTTSTNDAVVLNVGAVTNADGTLRTALYSDGHLHLGPAGCEVFSSKLKPALNVLIK